MWAVHVSVHVGYTCESHMGCACELCMWAVHVGCACGLCMWAVHVKVIWAVHMGYACECACGPCMWSVHAWPDYQQQTNTHDGKVSATQPEPVRACFLQLHVSNLSGIHLHASVHTYKHLR